MNFVILNDVDRYQCISFAVMESEESAAIDFYTREGWDYCQSCAGEINGERVVYLKFSKSFD
jgi:hypothetical protein